MARIYGAVGLSNSPYLSMKIEVGNVRVTTSEVQMVSDFRYRLSVFCRYVR